MNSAVYLLIVIDTATNQQLVRREDVAPGVNSLLYLFGRHAVEVHFELIELDVEPCKLHRTPAIYPTLHLRTSLQLPAVLESSNRVRPPKLIEWGSLALGDRAPDRVSLSINLECSPFSWLRVA